MSCFVLFIILLLYDLKNKNHLKVTQEICDLLLFHFFPNSKENIILGRASSTLVTFE